MTLATECKMTSGRQERKLVVTFTQCRWEMVLVWTNRTAVEKVRTLRIQNQQYICWWAGCGGELERKDLRVPWAFA